MAYGFKDDKTKVEMRTKAEIDDFIANINNSISGLNASLSALSSNLDALGDIVSNKTDFFIFSSENDMLTKLSTVSSPSVFLFRGLQDWTEQVLINGRNPSWGIGLKSNSTTFAFLTISTTKLWYTLYLVNGTSTTNHVIDLG